jgi:O-succinylbenzoic acid--CoA ligase
VKINNWLAASGAAFPDRTALVWRDESLSYAELERRAGGAARRLAGMGVARGDRVALGLVPSVDYVVLLHGLMKLGAVAAPLDLQSGDVRVEARFTVTEPEEVLEVREAEVELDETLELDAVQCLLHTSGTTGRPKLVQLTYGNQLWSALGSAARIGVDPDDRWLCSLPFHHVSGLSILLRSAIYGTGVVLEPFDPARIGALLGPGRVTLASCVATTLSRLLEAGAELDRLRCVLLGGGPLSLDLVADAVEAGVPVAPTYGLTEAASQVATLPPGQAARKPGSAGPQLLPTGVRIDESLIYVRGPTVSRDAAGKDGWLRTGDRGEIGEDGHLYVHGRADDMIVTGGENVFPGEVEQALRAHPEVAEVAVSGQEHPEWGQAIVATVVLREGGSVQEQELRDFCRERLAGYKVPKRVEFVARLPHDAGGEVRRTEADLSRDAL